MRTQVLTALATFALVGYISASPTMALGQTTTASPKEMSGKGDMMMGGMDMDHMKGMKEECMAKHKNGKMCDKKMIKKCEMKMSKNECKKMMEDTK